MKLIFIFISTFLIITNVYSVQIHPKDVVNQAPRLENKGAYNFAVDIASGSSLQNLQCIYQQGYKTIFAQIYTPNNGGQVNQQGCQAVINAYTANLGTEVYVTPSTTSSKTGAQQFDEAYNGMKNSGINIHSMWLQVTSPINWPNNLQSNVNFIQSFINRAIQYGVNPGIYTNWYDWQQITGSYVGFANQARLWYWNAYGQGPNAEGDANFNDFRTFGGWTQPNVKQFALNEGLCSLTLNRDVYPVGAKFDKMIKSELKQPTAGGFV